MTSSRFPFAVASLGVVLALSSAARAADPLPRYRDPSAPVDERVEDILGRLTLEEKIALVHANTRFTSGGVPRLGIPDFVMSDGPHGVREEFGPNPAGGRAPRTDDFVTYPPVAIALAATWNTALARAYGAEVGEEARWRGKHLMLGPAVNIMRTPLGGRNFEYLGEDPWLASRIAVDYIRGEQGEGVGSCVKHFALNNQETDRNSIDVQADERALREIYLPAFEAAVREAGVLAVMGAYNKFRGQFCCQNDYLLERVLEGEWGFRGAVVSDWNGVHDTREAALNGLDIEMGTRRPFEEYFLARPFREAIERGEIPVSVLDEKVRRVLRVMITVGALDERRPGAVNTPAHQALARRVAEESIVLLKNAGRLLPLEAGDVRSIAVIGDNATRQQSHGGWSSELKALYEITPLEGIVRRAGNRIPITYTDGYRPPRFVRTSDFDPSGAASTELSLPPSSREEMIARAVAAAKQADIAIVVAGLNHERNQDTEGSDRLDLRLPYGQDELIERVATANGNTIVVLVGGAPVEMPWLEKVPVVLQAWYPGMQGGTALASILFGDVSPSGRLPCTFPKQLADSPAHSGGARTFPGENGTVHYDEGVFVGYRWYDAKAIEPLFPFGFGLGYTMFSYTNLRLVPGIDGSVVNVEVDVQNLGVRDGAETVQVYVQDKEASVPRPPKELKGFAKVALGSAEKVTVSIPLGPRAFAFYSPERRGWVAEAGDFRILVGASSREIRLEEDFHLAQTLTPE